MAVTGLANLASAIGTAVSSASVREHPFPHLVLDPVLPHSLYALVRDNLPDDDEFIRHRSPDSVNDRNPHRTAWRLKLDPDDWRTPRDPSERYLFWVELAREMKRDELRETMLAKFGPWLRDVPARPEQIKTSVLLYRDEGGSRIGPHTDGPDKMIAGIFYLPTAGETVDCGTKLLEPRDPDFRAPEDYDHERFYDRPDLFRVVAAAPYQPNTALVMARGDLSFHSMEIPLEVPVRYSLMYRLDRR